MDERGSVSVLGVGILAVIGMAILLLGQLGADAVRWARATAVADAVAMAAAARPTCGGNDGGSQPGKAGFDGARGIRDRGGCGTRRRAGDG